MRPVPSNICDGFYFSPHSPRCFLFFCIVEFVGVFRHRTVPGDSRQLRRVSLQVKTFLFV